MKKIASNSPQNVTPPTPHFKQILAALVLMSTPQSLLAQFEKYKTPTQFEGAEAESSKPYLDNKASEAIVPPPPSLDVPAPEEMPAMGDMSDSFDGENSYGDFSDNESSGMGGPNNAKTGDAFGHGSGVSGSKTLTEKKDKKYVNLNPETAFGPEVITSFDFPNVTLADLTKHMQKLTGLNLIMDKDIKGKITIQAPTPITVGDAWKAYLSALSVNGYTLVDAGAFYKIVNARDIRYTPTKIYTGTYTPDTENYVMRIIPLKNIDAVEVSRSFRPFLSRYGRLIEIRQTNTLIIQDTGLNINRLTRLLKFLDVPGHDESLQIFKVKYSSAQEIAKLLDQLMKSKSTAKFSAGGPRGATNNVKLIAEPRTNSIIAMVNASVANQLRALIEKLDTRSSSNTNGQIHVYYLNHGDAETLAKTLSALVGNAKSSGGGSRLTPTAPVIPGGAAGADSGGPLFTEDVKITSDKDNNAIVVTASPTDWLTVRNVIDKLDIPRDQVYVEGMIMETNVNRGSGWGISILGAYGSGGAQKAGFTGGSGDLFNVLSNNITSLGGLFVGGGAGKKITYNDPASGKSVNINTVNGLISAIASTTDTNVLATPQILALDNTEAMFEVGESVPIPKTTLASGAPAQTAIEQQSVTMRLTITPQINKVTRFIKLKIKQKIEDFSERAVNNTAGGVATTIRNAETTVVVRDRDTIAMGGLMRDKETEKINKIPLLGDIPVLGWLFKNRAKNVDKVNLLFFLTPKIMSSYQKTVATTVKDLLNRRAAHLKYSSGADDTFKTTAKGLYDKASQQENGPLYDEEEAERYKNPNGLPSRNSPPENETTEVINLNPGASAAPTEHAVLDEPNYQEIAVKALETKNQGPKDPALENKAQEPPPSPNETSEAEVTP